MILEEPRKQLSPEPTYEEMVGWRIAELREQAKLSQRELGERLEEFLEKKLHRQSISVLESGGRGPTGAELAGLAEILRTTVSYLLTPPPGVKRVKVPSGKWRTRSQFEQLVLDPSGPVAPAMEAIGSVGNWLNEVLAGGTAEMRKLRDAYASIARGRHTLPDDGLRARQTDNEEQIREAHGYPADLDLNDLGTYLGGQKNREEADGDDQADRG